MANVTEHDRKVAAHIAADWSLHFDADQLDPLEAMIATFLAAERETADVTDRKPIVR